MEIYFKEISLEEGFAVAALSKNSRVVAGREVSLASGIGLFQSISGPITCWKCKCTADRWISTLGQNDKKSKPVLNLYATYTKKTKKGQLISKLVLMTRDHIIPKSRGGKDCVANLRPGCELCNGQRGSSMSKKDVKFMENHPELICPIRLAKGLEAAKRHEERLLELKNSSK